MSDSDKTDSKMMCGEMPSQQKSREKEGHSMMSMMHEHGEIGKQSGAMEKGMMESMMAGAHHVMVVVSEEETKKNIENAEVDIRIVPPSMKKSYGAELMTMKDHSCGGLVLDEEGEYVLIFSVNVGDKVHIADFKYKVG
jgi:hypothetical protein